jgi:CHAD domain-containing protein
LNKALKRYKKVRKALGRIRDFDVHRARWAEWAKGRRHFGAVDKEIVRKREKAMDRFRAEFEWTGLKKAARKLGKAVESGNAKAAASTAEGKKRLQTLIDKVLNDREIHEVRLDVKRLRYTLEGLEALAGGKKTASRNLPFLKELQGELGDINDLETMTRFLRKLRRKRADRWDHATAAAVEKSADDLDGRLLEERHRWDKLWPERRRRLKEITA